MTGFIILHQNYLIVVQFIGAINTFSLSCSIIRGQTSQKRKHCSNHSTLLIFKHFGFSLSTVWQWICCFPCCYECFPSDPNNVLFLSLQWTLEEFSVHTTSSSAKANLVIWFFLLMRGYSLQTPLSVQILINIYCILCMPKYRSLLC